MEEQSTYTIRVPKTLKDAFDKAAKTNDDTGSRLLRGYMRQYVEWDMQKHAQGDLLKQRQGKK